MPRKRNTDVGSLFPILAPLVGGLNPAKQNQLAPMGPAGDSSHATGCYYVNGITGSIQRECNPINAALLAGAGYMGRGWVPATPFNAFGTFAEAQDFANREHSLIIGNPGSIPGQIITGPQWPSQHGPGSGSGNGGTKTPASGDDWAHLMTRLAEFSIGAILVIIGLNAIMSRTKGYQRVETVVTGVAGKVPVV